MDTAYTPFMRDLELNFKKSSGLVDRSAFKIFYCQVRPAKILTLGINPGGSPANTHPNGFTHLNDVPHRSMRTTNMISSTVNGERTLDSARFWSHFWAAMLHGFGLRL